MVRKLGPIVSAGETQLSDFHKSNRGTWQVDPLLNFACFSGRVEPIPMALFGRLHGLPIKSSHIAITEKIVSFAERTFPEKSALPPLR